MRSRYPISPSRSVKPNCNSESLLMRLIKGSLVGLVLAGILALAPTAAFAHGGGGGGHGGGGGGVGGGNGGGFGGGHGLGRGGPFCTRFGDRELPASGENLQWSHRPAAPV